MYSTETESDLLLEVKDISKTFPGVQALTSINLQLKKGEVLALVGENGAGKSTLMKILAGVQSADAGSGEILFQGRRVQYANPLEAKQDGIVMIYQELSLVPDLSVAENIFLGSLPLRSRGIVDWKKLINDTRDILQKIDSNVDPLTVVRSLPIADQQIIEIGRALAFGAKVIVFDEPTSSLTDKEKAILFKNIQNLREQRVGIIYISHKMDEIFEISDRITVFCDGRNKGTRQTSKTSLSEITALMIGRSLDDYYHKSRAEPGKVVLKVEDLSIKDMYQDITFEVRSGEVVGLYGLVGAGRTEIVETIFGVRKKTSGTLMFDGAHVKISSSKDAVNIGIGLVPEDRKNQGLVLGMSCQENVSLAKLPAISNKLGVVDKKAPYRIYEEFRKKLGIVSPSASQKVLFLSGGNQQKVVIGKWLAIGPKLLILDEPTRGIDVGSKAEIHKVIASLAENGLAVLVISSEMPEIIGISNRIIAIKEGRIVGEFQGNEITESNLIQAIT